MMSDVEVNGSGSVTAPPRFTTGAFVAADDSRANQYDAGCAPNGTTTGVPSARENSTRSVAVVPGSLCTPIIKRDCVWFSKFGATLAMTAATRRASSSSTRYCRSEAWNS